MLQAVDFLSGAMALSYGDKKNYNETPLVGYLRHPITFYYFFLPTFCASGAYQNNDVPKLNYLMSILLSHQ